MCTVYVLTKTLSSTRLCLTMERPHMSKMCFYLKFLIHNEILATFKLAKFVYTFAHLFSVYYFYIEVPLSYHSQEFLVVKMTLFLPLVGVCAGFKSKSRVKCGT